MYEIERFIAYLLTPFPIFLLLLLAGTILLFSKKRIKLGKILVVLSLFLILLLSSFKIPQMIALAIEKKYPSNSMRLSDIRNEVANTGRPIKWIVVLAGGSTNDKRLSTVDNLSFSTLKRLTEGLILYKKFKDSKLILSGGNPIEADYKEADYMRRFCLQIGIPKEDIIVEKRSKETFEQVNEIKKIVKNDKFVLISSTLHFPRAELMFKKIGLNPIVFPTDFKPDSDYHWHDYIPDEEGITTAKELLISLWAYLGAWIKGQI